MSLSPATLGILLDSTAGATYTPTGGYNARLEAATLTNTSAATVTVDLWRGSATTANVSMQTKSLTAGQTYVVKELIGQWLLDGSSIYARASTAGVVALVMSALEFVVPS